jgi:uncharacterized protein involved in oxidation of intracellular sulfur
MKTLVILNEAPYGSERTYNGLRLAGALARQEGNEVHVFLIGDAASAAHSQQKTPSGYYNVETMLATIVGHGGVIGVCGSCMDARAITADDLIDGSHRSSLDELAQWTTWADKAVAF